MIRLLALTALCACADPGLQGPDAPVPDAPAAVIVLGTVDGTPQGFAAMSGDQTLVAGAQGGFHIWLKYRVTGLDGRTVRVVRTVRRVADDRLILNADDATDLGASGPDGYYELPSPVPCFMCPAPLGVQVNDEPVRFDVKILDPVTKAVLADGQAQITPRCPDGNTFCVKACSGM